MSKGSRLAKGTVIYAIGNFGTKLIAFLIVPLYTYYISPDDMGDYDILMSTIALLTPIITMRISDAAYRWMLHHIEEDRLCISAAYRVMIISSIISLGLTLLVNAFVPIKFCAYFCVLLILGRWLESLQTLLRGLEERKLFAVSGLLYTGIFVTLNVIKIVVFGEGVTAMLQSTAISEIIVIVFILVCTPQLRTKVISDSDNRQLTKSMLAYSAPLVPSGLSWWVMGLSDRYVVRYYLGPALTGIYAVANKFPSIMTMVFAIFNNAWTDLALADLKEGSETSEYSSLVFEKLYRLSFSFVLFLIPATKLFAGNVLGEAYRSAAVYIGFLYLGSVFQGFTSFISAGLLQGTDTRPIAGSSMAGAAVNLIIDICMIGFIGLHAASISTFCGFFIMWLVRMREVNRTAPVNIKYGEFGCFLLLSVVMAAVTVFTGFITDVVLSAVFLAVFVVLNAPLIKEIISKGRPGGIFGS
ncbi:MAG: oligosaccharide flippase family protein [Lachnospiraceae bacterium]|nr:oligosaccharide flippase family protein [Lachnospiraceae bacterium]